MNVCFDFYDNINSPTELYLFLVFKLFSFLMTHNFYVYCTQHPTTTNDNDIEQNYQNYTEILWHNIFPFSAAIAFYTVSLFPKNDVFKPVISMVEVSSRIVCLMN